MAVYNGTANADTYNGTAQSDTIYGNGGNDTLNGLGGSDTIYGGTGDDRIDGGEANDFVYGDSGNDTHFGGVGDDTIDGGIGNDTTRGNDGADTINGGDGDDTIDGGTGSDRITGGLGADILDGGINTDADFFIFNIGPVSDSTPIAPDTIRFFDRRYDKLWLPATVNDKRLVFHEEASSFVGPSSNAVQLSASLVGDGYADIVWKLDSAAGTAAMWVDVDDNGTFGNADLYITFTNITVGFDWTIFYHPVVRAGSATGGTITGTAATDELRGGAGNDLIYGKAGADILYGGDGDDYIEGDDFNSGQAFDDTLYGGGGNDRLVGERGSDTLYGGDGNDLLDGQGWMGTGGDGAGNSVFAASYNWFDRYYGGAGNDTVFQSWATVEIDMGVGDDHVNLNSTRGTFVDGGAGFDSIWFNYQYESYLHRNVVPLGQDWEAPIGIRIDLSAMWSGGEGVIGSTKVAETLSVYGFEQLRGFATQDSVIATFDGNDRVIIGADYLLDTFGGIHTRGGDDYVVAGSGADYITLGTGNDHAEGGRGNDNIHGEDGNDQLFGQAGNDLVNGGAGDDLIEGGDGDDQLSGGGGSDTLRGGAGNDGLSAAFNDPGATTIDYLSGDAGNDSFGDLYGTVHADGGEGDDFFLVQSTSGSVVGGTGTDRVGFSYFYHPLVGGQPAGILIDLSAVWGGGVGTVSSTAGGAPMTVSGIERLSGVAQQDPVINTFGGNDRIVVGAGYLYDIGLPGFGGISTGGGDDQIIGGSGVDIIHAGAGKDCLDGGAGGDRMYGGAGDDAYSVDSVADLVSEAPGEGYDRVYVGANWSLDGNSAVELLIASTAGGVNMTGNGYNQTLLGNDFDNQLDGGGGVDTTDGGLGNDWHLVDHASDNVIERAGEGYDRVVASTSYRLAIGAEVELMITSNAAGTEAINLYGSNTANSIQGNAGANTLDGLGGNDALYGFGGNDVLDGGIGADSMFGGTGDDWYVIDHVDDQAIELDGQGYDRIFTDIDYRIGENQSVELLMTVNPGGLGALKLTGNGLSNTIIGNEGANTLIGNGGFDRLEGNGGDDLLDGGDQTDFLYGGAGADTFRFSTILDGSADLIGDFQSGLDRIQLSQAFFALSAGALPPGAFVVGTAAQDADDRIVYDQATGRLFFDADGSGAGAAVLFAQLGAGTVLQASDFNVF